MANKALFDSLKYQVRRDFKRLCQESIDLDIKTSTRRPRAPLAKMVFKSDDHSQAVEPLPTPIDDEKGSVPSNTPTLHDGNDEVEQQPAPNLETKEEVEDHEQYYLTGWKLASLMISITLAAFLMLLDMSIIVTVC